MRGTPDSPEQLAPAAWRYALGRSARSFLSQHRFDAAAGLTFYGVVAVFPAILVVVSSLAVIGERGRLLRSVLDLVADVAPPEMFSAIRERALEFGESRAVGAAAVTGLIVALWSASAYVAAFGRAMNRIYGLAEGRPVWRLRPAQLLVTAAILGIVFVLVVLVLTSGSVAETIARDLGLWEELQLVWSIVRWPLIVAALVLLIALLYGATPNVRHPRFRWLSIGAIVAVAVIAAVSFGFALYASRFADYDRVYGSLTGVVVFLLWFWLANCGLLFGATFDAELERARELQAGVPAEERIHVAAKDTRRLENLAARQAEERARARRLRRQR